VSQPFLVWVWVWKISPKNPNFFNIFPSDQKVPGSKMGQPLIYCGSKVCLGWVRLRPVSYFQGIFSNPIDIFHISFNYHRRKNFAFPTMSRMGDLISSNFPWAAPGSCWLVENKVPFSKAICCKSQHYSHSLDLVLE